MVACKTGLKAVIQDNTWLSKSDTEPDMQTRSPHIQEADARQKYDYNFKTRASLVCLWAGGHSGVHGDEILSCETLKKKKSWKTISRVTLQSAAYSKELRFYGFSLPS